MWSAIFFLLQATTISCITFVKDKGLLTVQEKNIYVRNINGARYHVHAGKDQQYMQYLSGCILTVEGFNFFHHLYVKKWSIQDAGAGSAPFFGMLQRQGMQWMIQDHNTNGIIILENLQEHLVPHTDRIIMVGGYVVGPQRIHVVSARYLDGEK